MKMLLLGSLLALSACTRSTDPRLYTLVAQRAAATYPVVTTLEVRRPSIAGYLDRRDIVRGVVDEQLQVSADANWAEPLDSMLGRVLADELALRLPNSRVFSDLNTLGASPDTRIDIELQRFEQGSDGLVLRAQVALHRSAAPGDEAIARFEARDEGAHRGTQELVSALDRLVGKLADQLAQMVAQAVTSAPAPAPAL